MQEYLVWFIASAATMALLLLAPRRARRHRKGINVDVERR